MRSAATRLSARPGGCVRIRCFWTSACRAESTGTKSQGNTMRIIAVTAYGADADRQRALEAGIDLHLIKPADIKMVESLLG